MTKYLNGQPFSNAVSSGQMTDLQYDIAVGKLVFCPTCGDYVRPGELETCPNRKLNEPD